MEQNQNKVSGQWEWTFHCVGVFYSSWFHWRKNIDRLWELHENESLSISCCSQNLRDFFLRIIGPNLDYWFCRSYLILVYLLVLSLTVPSFSIASISGVLSYTSCRIHKINVENMENTSSRAGYTTVTTNQPWTVSFSKMLKSKQVVDVE